MDSFFNREQTNPRHVKNFLQIFNVLYWHLFRILYSMSVNKKEKQKNYLYYFQNITMNNTTRLNQRVERATQTKWFNYLRTLLVAALLGCSVNWTAQDVQSQNIQPQEVELQEQPATLKKDPAFSVHGMVSLWTNGIAWDAAEVCSTNPTLIGMVDVSHKSWLGFTAIRLDDWQSDPNQPASRVTILNPHLTKRFWKNNEIKVDLEWKYAMLDKMPESNGFSPDVVWSYSTENGFTFEWMYSHKFKKWPDSDAFRLSISKKIDEALKLTAQWWYETGYDKHFYGRLMLDINLWNWLKAQVSLIAKNGELTPTTCIVYAF